MGITGLLPFLKNALTNTSLSSLSGQTAGVDVYGWLHKGAFGCAEKLVQGQDTDGIILYVMKYINLLLYYNIKPILVFDGRNLPSKAVTETKRRENREKYKKIAKEYLRNGRLKEARECFQRCVDITFQMAYKVIEACRSRNIDCIVAPYEADAQLAYLSKIQVIQFVISEDSDLTTFGCQKILFKLNINGSGMMYESSKLMTVLGSNFNFDKFRYMCIMSGCDYLPSLPGIGLAKSFKFWNRAMNPNLESVLRKIPSYLNMPNLIVNSEYIQGFIQANQTFLHQVVYDPLLRQLLPFNDYESSNSEPFSYCGQFVSQELAYQMALGNVDLLSLKIIKSKHSAVLDNPCKYGKPYFGESSIWKSGDGPLRETDTNTERKRKFSTENSADSKAGKVYTAIKKKFNYETSEMEIEQKTIIISKYFTIDDSSLNYNNKYDRREEKGRISGGEWLKLLESTNEKKEIGGKEDEEDEGKEKDETEEENKIKANEPHVPFVKKPPKMSVRSLSPILTTPTMTSPYFSSNSSSSCRSSSSSNKFKKAKPSGLMKNQSSILNFLNKSKMKKE